MKNNAALILPFIAGISMSMSTLCLKKATEETSLPGHFLIVKSSFIIITILGALTPRLSFIGSFLPLTLGFFAGFLSTTSMVMWGMASSLANPGLVSSFFTMSSVVSPIITSILIKPEGTNIGYNVFNLAGLLICAGSLVFTNYKNRAIGGNKWIKFATVGLVACLFTEVILFLLSLRMTGIKSGITIVDYFQAIDSPKCYLIGVSTSTIILQLLFCNKVFTKLNKKFIVLGFSSAVFDLILSLLTVSAIPLVDNSKLPILFAMVAAGYICGCSAWSKIVYNHKSLILNHTIFFIGMIVSTLG